MFDYIGNPILVSLIFQGVYVVMTSEKKKRCSCSSSNRQAIRNRPTNAILLSTKSVFDL
jgi:hypothetical protein